MKPRILSLTTAALAAACANPVSDPGRQIGVIGSASESIVMPDGRDTVLADVPFTVTINTFAVPCVQPDGAEVTVTTTMATIVPFDRYPEASTVCITIMAARPHPVTLQFPAGRATIRVEGRQFSSEGGTKLGHVDRVIQVVPSQLQDGVITARPIGDDSLELANASGEQVFYFAIEKGAASLALWAVCVNPATCPSIPAHAAVRRPNTDIALYQPGDTEIHVYWWHLVAAGDGTFKHDVIRSFVVTLPAR